MPVSVCPGIMQDEDRPDVGLLLQLAQQLSAKCHKDPEVVFLVGAIIYQLSACQTTRAIVAQVGHEGARGGGPLTDDLRLAGAAVGAGPL